MPGRQRSENWLCPQSGKARAHLISTLNILDARDYKSDGAEGVLFETIQVHSISQESAEYKDTVENLFSR